MIKHNIFKEASIEKRKLIFEENLIEIKLHNSNENHSWKKGVN